MELFKKFILDIHPLSKKPLKEFTDLFIYKKFKAGEFLGEIGDIPIKLFYLQKGIVKIYTSFPNGNKYVRNIYTSNIIVSSYTALIKKSKSNYNIECITDCEVLECNYEEIIKLSERDLDIAIFIRKNIEMLYITYIERNVEFLTNDATQRYKNLIKKIPEIEDLLTQKEIASHLAITKMQLNRLKKKL